MADMHVLEKAVEEARRLMARFGVNCPPTAEDLRLWFEADTLNPKQENIKADLFVLKTIADRSKGDVRSAGNDLQSLCFNRKQIRSEDIDVLGYRDRGTLIFDALREVFKTKNLQNSRDCIRYTDVEPEMLLLWISENIFREYLDIEDLVRGYDAISKADVFFGRVKKGRYYDLWSYACDLMSSGVSLAKSHIYGNNQYTFPLWMKEMKANQSARLIRDSVTNKISTRNHASGQMNPASLRGIDGPGCLAAWDLRFYVHLTLDHPSWMSHWDVIATIDDGNRERAGPCIGRHEPGQCLQWREGGDGASTLQYLNHVVAKENKP